MDAENLLYLIIFSFISALILVRLQIWSFRKKGLVAIDYYKKDRRKVVTCGGLSLIIVILLTSLIWRIGECDSLAIITIIAFGLFGLLDDFVDVGRLTKVVIPFFFTLPLLTFLDGGVLPLIGKVGLAYFIISSVYVMVTANLINMHSGFNGLAVGLSTILIFFLLLKSLMFGRGHELLLGGMLGSLLGLLYYNWYPSKIFDGNVGSMTMGATIGLGIVLCGFMVSGFLMLIPHTANFLMYVYWRIMRKLHPEDGRWALVKFGRVREDGTLEVPNNLTLKWVLPHRFRMTERQVVLAMYGLTTVFCLLALPLPY